MTPSQRSRVWSFTGALVAALLLIAPTLQAQQTGTVTGRVTDSRSGQPVPSVQVFIEGLNLAVLTQQNGRYLLQNVPAGTHTVTADRIGYRTATEEVTVPAGENVVQNFTVAEEALQLDEVIVTGTPGGQERRAIGNAVSQVDAGQITERVAISNMQELLTARTPGLNFTRLTGNVGEGSSINIRGYSSITLGNQPLVYIDGVRMDKSFGEGPQTQGSNFFGPDNILGAGLSRDAEGASGSALDDLNPNDIESIEVIKGPAAATLYGTEASAGVIQIITKKGTEGDAQFNFSIRQGANWMMDPAGRIGPQYACPDTDDPGDLGFGSRLDDTPCALSEVQEFNIYENEENVFGNSIFDYGHTQSYNLSVRGGTSTVRYYVSADWSDEDGIVPHNWDERLATRANLSVVFSDNFTVDASLGYIDGETRYANPEPIFGGTWRLLMFPQHETLEDEDERGFLGRTPEDFSRVDARRDFSRFTGSLTATHTYSDWFTQRLVVGVDRNWTQNSVLTPRAPEAVGPFANFLGPFPTRGGLGALEIQRPVEEQVTFDYSTTADWQYNDMLNFSTSVGAQFYADQTDEIRIEAEVFPTPVDRNLSTAQEIADLPRNRFRENKSAGFYIQEQVGINDRIFVTGAVRADDSSTFGSDFDLVYYPKVSGTWVISEEDFWNVDFLNSLRLRAAWGESGRQPGPFAAIDQYTPESASPGGQPALIPTSNRRGNPDIGPERSSEIEVGADFAVLDDRISGEFTYYSQRTEDALVPQDLAPSQPFGGSIQNNAGEIKNWGWEAAVNARVYETSGFAFDLNVSGSHSDNEITVLSDEILGDLNFRRGWFYPNVVFTGLTNVDGRYDANGNLIGVTNLMCDAGKAPDVNGREGGAALEPGGPSRPCDETIDAEKNLMYGRAFPTHTWSISPTFSFLENSLQVFGLVEGQFGRWLANIDTEDRSWGDDEDYNALPAVTLQDPYFVAATRAALGGLPNDFQDERWLGRYDADFWKLREVGVRYQLPQAWVEGWGADRASISVSGRELWTIWRRQETDFSGVKLADPEQVLGFSGEPNFSFGNTPPLSSLSVNLRVTF